MNHQQFCPNIFPITVEGKIRTSIKLHKTSNYTKTRDTKTHIGLLKPNKTVSQQNTQDKQTKTLKRWYNDVV